MSRSILEYLEHIETEASYLFEETKLLSYDDYISNDTLRRASLRSLEIIGEATKNVPAEFRNQHSEIEWKRMAGMRDKLIHAYFGVDYEIVWSVLQTQIPTLKQQIQPVIEETKE